MAAKSQRVSRFAAPLCALAFLASCALQQDAQDTTSRYQRIESGIVITPADGPAKAVRIEFYADDIIRVTASPADSIETPESLMVVAEPKDVAFDVAEANGVVTLSSAGASASVSLDTGLISFNNAHGETVLEEAVRDAFTPIEVEGQNFFSVRQQFNRGTDEGFFGLGQHQNGQMNYNGEDVVLAQHNISIAMPFVVSTRNYGVLWDNNSITRFGDAREYGPLNASLTLYDRTGAEGGLTASYENADGLVLSRVEADPDFQYLPADQYLHEPAVRGAWPAEFNNQSPARVTFEGAIESAETGVHKFRLYASSYIKLWIDGELVIDRWRQNWNPWYHNFDLPMTAGVKHDIRIEWLPNDGYFRLLHLEPLPDAERHQLSLWSELARNVDYYVVLGDDMEDAIAGYRKLTGAAVLLPRWAYGFWQSRQRYTTQQELLDVVREYRDRDIPLDNIVLDWFYWPEDAWGSHQFDAERFPDGGAMVDAVHDMNAQIMISVWPKFYPATDNYKELDAGGHIYRRQIEMKSRDWVGPGYPSTFYDPYSAEARQIYWRQMYENLGRLGFDAWWMDATEPDSHSNLTIEERKLRMGPTAIGPGAEFFNSFALMNSRAVYEGLKSVDPTDRAMILTRSGFPGIQRYGSAVWSGDVTARWDDLRDQISAGVNISMSGLPNWTTDIGGFAVEDRYTNEDPAHLVEWRELNLRWFQFGAFSPLFRSHGEFPYREIFNIAPRGSEVQNAMIWYDRLRYRLMPYIYAQAAGTYFNNGVIMRGLVMDFPEDRAAWDVNDEYLFGPSFLVAPVTEFGARARNVYLPEGTAWYDFYTGTRYDGGQTIDATAPLSRMPLFVRAGAIIPTGPQVEYAAQSPNGPITLTIYRGADAAFTLYDDDGETISYADGAFSRIPIRYDDATGAVTIGAREGSYPGMAETRVFNIRWISGRDRNAVDFDARTPRTVRYTGAEVIVHSP